jgi:protein-arginine kinase activator protein McsA
MNDAAFDKSEQEFDGKQYKQSLYSLLDYLNGSFRTKYGNAEGTEFTIPHGSVVLNLKLEDEELKITAPFLSLPEKNRVPLLRQIAGLNFNNMDLAAVVLKDNQLFFEYACPLSLVNPYKIYYVLREICSTGDKYDDEFVTKFGAERIYEPVVTPYDSQTVDTIYDIIQLSCKECFDTLKEFENSRKYGYAWYIIDITLMKILYYAHPQGQLMNDLNKAVGNMDRDDIPLPEIAGQGKQMLERLQNMTKEALAEDLYYVETFVPDKYRSGLKNIQANFETSYENVSKAIENNDYLYCYLTIVFQFYKMYFYNLVQDDINALVVNAMQRSSAKPLEEAAQILYEAMTNIMDGNLTPPMETVQAEMNVADYMGELAKNMQDIVASMFGQNKKD